MAAVVSEAELAKSVSTAVNCANAAESGDTAEEKRAVDTLKFLSKLTVTAELLRVTDAGKKISKLKKHSSSKISQTAVLVVDSWKNCVRQQTLSDKPQQEKPAASKATQGKPDIKPVQEKSSKPAPVRSTGPTPSSGKDNGAAAKPKYSKPAPSGNDPRYKIREAIADALAKAMDSVDIPDPDPWKVAVAVECALFQQHGGMNSEYKAKFRSLSFNLKDANNTWLRSNVLDGTVSPDKLVTMSSEEMASEDRKKENDRIREDMTKEAVRGNNQQASTDMFQCSKCKQRKCTYFQMQTRSADEPMTTFVTCTVCSNKWKFC